ncbi:MAG TPA: DUF1501 domain-containing protein [Verrucomicrobiae bacterium]|nr:DUF1501 domain-containing protein [Verrucomicrobiae bacterium]
MNRAHQSGAGGWMQRPANNLWSKTPGAPSLSRREMLEKSGLGLGALALHTLFGAGHARAENGSGSAHPFQARRPQDRPAARAVILLMQNGGPSQMDLFDPKPDLTRFEGKVHGEKVEMFQKGSEANKLLGTPFRFYRQGICGMEMSEVIPYLGTVADELCMIRSMRTEHNNHTEGLVMFNTGKIFPGRPALGSWISYALGTENQNLPAYVVLRDPDGYNTSGTLLWQNGWMPALYRGTEISTRGAPILNLHPAEPVPADVQRENLDLLARLNSKHREAYPQETELEARIHNYELAARLQLAAADLLDLDRESPATRKLYGLDQDATAGYGLRCLMARRLVEAGVRFVQVFPPVKPQFQPWDSHSNVKTELEKICAACDQPSAALIQDLKSRGLLDSTIVIWSGEFGRLPVSQNGAGRDHNRNAFTTLVAGGGFRPGYIHGATDEVGYRAVQSPVTVPDLHATLLHQLGLDHDRVTYLHSGREETLTDSPVTGARVVRELVVHV